MLAPSPLSSSIKCRLKILKLQLIPESSELETPPIERLPASQRIRKSFRFREKTFEGRKTVIMRKQKREIKFFLFIVGLLRSGLLNNKLFNMKLRVVDDF